MLDNVLDEWRGQLEDPQEALSGWQSGMRMFDEGPLPMQRFNAAEYMTRALAYSLLGEPLLSTADAVTSVRRILQLVELVPRDSWQMKFAPRIARLALAVCRLNGWQPTNLNGDGQVTEEILAADRHSVVRTAVRSPGIPEDKAMEHFFLTT